MKFKVFWYVAPCNHFEIDSCFRGDGGSMQIYLNMKNSKQVSIMLNI
jgi:hypothetical protein